MSTTGKFMLLLCLSLVTGIILTESLSYYLRNENLEVQLAELQAKTNHVVEEQLATNAYNIYQGISHAIQDALWRGQMSELITILKSQQNLPGLSNFKLYDSEGDLKYSSHPTDPNTKLSPELHALLMQETQIKEIREDDSFNIYESFAVEDHRCIRCHMDWKIGEIRGINHLSYSARSVQENQAQIGAHIDNISHDNSVAILANTLILLTVVSSISYFLIRRYLEADLRQLHAALFPGPANTNKGKPFQIDKSIDEIRNLFRRLKDNELKLVQHQEHLEDEVAKRTHESEEARKAAISANNAKSVFLANMSHELRTPLNGILGYADILKRKTRARSSESNGLSIIQESGKHLLGLINDILDLSKIEAHKFELAEDRIQLSRLLENVLTMLRSRADEKGIALKLEYGTNLPYAVSADEQRLRQVLLNLIGNAIKFTEEGSVTLSIGATFQSESDLGKCQILFEVIDTGVGISEDDQSKIFQPFEQVGSIHNKRAGTGLGLSISRELISAMGGEIKLQSTEGSGSCFYFSLDLPTLDEQEFEQTEVAAPEESIIGYQGPVKSVLVADDNQYNRMFLRDLIQPLGFRTKEAEDGSEILALVESEAFDLIITDLQMPNMNGFEAAQTLRASEKTKHLPIIAVSASVSEDDLKAAQAAGCNETLEKPIDTPHLFQLIAKHLQIQWIYSDEAQPPKQNDHDRENWSEIPFPDHSVVEQLIELVSHGNMSKVKKVSRSLVEQDEQYEPFANLVNDLAQKFDEEGLIEFLECKKANAS